MLETGLREGPALRGIAEEIGDGQNPRLAVKDRHGHRGLAEHFRERTAGG